VIFFAFMRNRSRFGPIFLLIFGLLPLFRVTTGERFAGYYKPDVLALVGAGMCFGAAIVLLAVLRRESRTP
jgi:asparagine N-glycosylation enzyme membrane subunit Stt3